MEHRTMLEQNIAYSAYLADMGFSEGDLIEELSEQMDDAVVDAIDGCSVEPDGYCQHGYPSVLLWLGLI